MRMPSFSPRPTSASDPCIMSNAPDGTLYIVDMYRGSHPGPSVDDVSTFATTSRIATAGPPDRTRPRSTGSCTRRPSVTPRPRSRPRRRRSWSRPSRIRTDGGARRRSGCSSSDGGCPSRGHPSRRSCDWRERSTDWRARLHALWTLDGLDRIEPALLTRALVDESRDVRASAIRIAERWLPEAEPPDSGRGASHGSTDRRLGGAASAGGLTRRAAARPA